MQVLVVWCKVLLLLLIFHDFLILDCCGAEVFWLLTLPLYAKFTWVFTSVVVWGLFSGGLLDFARFVAVHDT